MERVRKQNSRIADQQRVAQAKFTSRSRESGFAKEIDESPAMVAQRKNLDGLFGGAIQRVKDEEPLQGKFETIQRVEDEEPLQGKFETAQRVEDEEPLQGKFETAQRVEEEEPLQGKFEAASSVQRKEEAAKPNDTGLPDNLKSGIESLSGVSMDNVKVHYNSSQPAQLNAHAYAQGTDIHLAPGQEQHLPHEAWHVVQQAQGRVQPTMQMKQGVPVNDDKSLEHEADVMGDRAMQMAKRGEAGIGSYVQPIQKSGTLPMQLMTHITYNPVNQRPGADQIVGMLHARVAHTGAQKNTAATNSGYIDAAHAPGFCNHHVPYKMIMDHVNYQISAQTNVTNSVGWLTTRAIPGVPTPVIPNTGTLVARTYDEAVLNGQVDQLVSNAANDSRNLFYWPGHTGDGAGTLIDEPWGKGAMSVDTLRGNLRAYQGTLRAQGLIP